jgi:phosphoglycolate phosphatase-like HAD superfamily hydrolase
MPMPEGRRLVLFDIDGTLITDGGAARFSFAEALRSVFGYEGDLGRYDFSGRTDPQITLMVLRDAGWKDADVAARFDDLWRVYLEGLSRNATPDRVCALPGIPSLLDALKDQVTLGLLTGNIEPGARLKLAPPGLNDYFPFGAFGSDSANREELPPIAIRRAGSPFSGEDVVIIGDSIYDVRCGVPYGATTIAIASGKTPAELLRAENPRHFFESAEDLDALLAAIL